MSDSEEENYCFFGKPLEPYDEDAFPKKKPISLEEQIATDAQGRRRFHGAFTGGFSAGFYNTVGSLEGWTPSEFKSTRQEKTESKTQKPEDFMDDEDMGEFGIAPQTVRATSDYSTSKKRRRQVFSDGPIPGEPVLHSILTSGNETIGYLLLKNIGLKDRRSARESELASEGKVYGCEMPKNYEISRDDEFCQYKIPDIYKESLQKPKDNTFGLGYEGLDKSHLNLFQSAKLVIQEKNKKKLSISGQAFGVGAFEDEDEDIYVKEDMSRYDFELTSEKALKKHMSKDTQTIFDDFVTSKNPLPKKEIFLPPTIPHSFTGKHKIKRSRFEPLPSETATPERKNMNPETRAKYLGEEQPNETPLPDRIIETKQTTPKQETVNNEKEQDVQSSEEKNFELYSLSSRALLFDRFIPASKPENPHDILEAVQPSETEHGTQEMRDAARMKMFGPLTRITADWQPCSLLCKRFNVPEPHCELNASKDKKKTKNLIFEYEKFTDISVTDFKPGLSAKETCQVHDESISDNITDAQNVPENVIPMQNTDEPTTSKDSENKQDRQEVAKDITEKIDVNKNIDLFKAVFLSSSESEGEGEAETEKTDTPGQNDKYTEMKTSVLSDTLLPKIKPIKEGILSNMDFSMFQNPSNVSKEKIEENKREEHISDSSQRRHELSYGPALPTTSQSTTMNKSFTQYRVDDDSDQWIEKTKKDKKNKTNHKKKHKKSAHKKKHKHSRE